MSDTTGDRSTSTSALVGIIMGSKSDWQTMRGAAEVLRSFGVPYECRVVSAHRTPMLVGEYASSARARGLRVIIAGAGGAAHLPGVTAAHTNLPVIGVPIQSTGLLGLDSLLSIAQMPRGVPVATMAIGTPGACNAAFLSVRMLAMDCPDLAANLDAFQEEQRAAVEAEVLE